MTKQVTLYYTDGCHLCDDAMVLLAQLNLDYQKVDIITEQRLVDLYSTTIPVVATSAPSSLNWPFSLQQLQQFIEEK